MDEDFEYRSSYDGYHDKSSDKKRLFKMKKGRVQGDFITYFALHNLISMLLFFWIAIPLGFFEQKTEVISDIFSLTFLELIVNVFALTLFTGIISRVFGWLLLRFIVVYWRKREMKKFGELNQGINKISIVYILSIFVSSVLFAIGALTILQYVIFGAESLITLVATYIILKIGVYLLIRFFSGAKL